jgi:hypothetical protein
MDPEQRQSAFLQALVTEHFVMQTAAGVAVNEQASRASIYLVSLSSSLVGMGFASQSREAFIPFVATVLPAIFLLGVVTVARLVDISAESYLFLGTIGRIRGYYRTLTPEAAELFDEKSGRWPEKGSPAAPHSRFMAFATTAASMVAFINSIVAGAGTALLLRWLLGRDLTWVAIAAGVTIAVVMVGIFVAYQDWRFRVTPGLDRDRDAG